MEKQKEKCDGKCALKQCDNPTDIVRKRMSKRKENDFTGKSHLQYKKLNEMDRETLDTLEKMEEGELNGQ